MAKLGRFLKKEPILTAAALAAVVSCFLVPPDAGYLGYVDFRTLALLYCLMLVVAGLRKAGAFERLAHLASLAHSNTPNRQARRVDCRFCRCSRRPSAHRIPRSPNHQ